MEMESFFIITLVIVLVLTVFPAYIYITNPIDTDMQYAIITHDDYIIVLNEDNYINFIKGKPLLGSYVVNFQNYRAKEKHKNILVSELKKSKDKYSSKKIYNINLCLILDENVLSYIVESDIEFFEYDQLINNIMLELDKKIEKLSK